MNAFKHTTRYALTLVLLALALTGCGRPQEEDDAALLSGVNLTELKFVKDIVMGSEYGGDGRCTKFTRSPRVSLFLYDSDSRSRNAFSNAVFQINTVLNGSGIQLQVVGDSDPSADIKVHFAPSWKFGDIARQYNIGYIAGNTGFFQTSWNGNHEISNASVMLATDMLQGTQLFSVALEELTQALGLGKDQGYYRDSIFYETSSDPGFAQSFSALDVRVIRFFYKYVSPGDGEREINRKFARYWN